MDNNRQSAGVDSILEELKAKGTTAATPPGRSVDDILAEMGIGKTGAPTAPPTAPAPSPSKAEAPPKPAAAPASKAPPPQKPEPKPQPKPEPVEEKQPEPEPKASVQTDKDTGKPLTETAILRMGKAAALDWVDPDKFADDPEITRWFDNTGHLPTSRKEQKRAEKEMRRRLADELREEKRQARQARKDGLPDEDDDYGENYYETGPEEDDERAFYEADAFTEEEEEVIISAPIKQEPEFDAFEERLEQDKAIAPEDTQAFFAPPAAQPTMETPLTPGARKESAYSKAVTQPVHVSETGYIPDMTAQFKAIDVEALADAGEEYFTPKKVPFDTDAVLKAVKETIPNPNVKPESGEKLPEGTEPLDTRSFDIESSDDATGRIPSAAFTHEFDSPEAAKAEAVTGTKSLYLDDMVDDRFRDFFSETVSVDRADIDAASKSRRKKKKSRSGVLTGEFAKLADTPEELDAIIPGEFMDGAEDMEDDADDYNRPQDAPAISGDITSLCRTLSRRTVISVILGVLMLWMGFAFSSGLWVPGPIAFTENPVLFASIYLVLLVGVIAANFTTVSSGLVGLFSAPTTDSTAALATLGSTIQGVVLLVQAVTKTVPESNWTLFGGLCALLLAFNAYGKRIRAVSILRNFKLASAGMDHSAAYILDSSNELALNVTRGLEERDPVLMLSRPTTLVKGFLRQSFSQRGTDRTGRVLGWVVFAVAAVAAAITWLLVDKQLFTVVSVFAAALAIGAPLSSTLVSGVPSLLLQRSAARVGAVVPGWSAIEDLGGVNVVMATARDLFPPSAVYLKGIKTFEKERVDIAILYAASVLIEGCDTLRDIFMGVIQGKSDMLYKVESMTKEPGRGFTAWVQNNRVVVGSREMLQKHDIQPPNIELEMKFVPEGHMPVYLAVSGKLFAMFIVGYGADSEVADTLTSLIKSGVSLLVHSDDMNVTGELIEHAYDLPPGVVKVLSQHDLDILTPLTRYIPESEGVMTHIGTFSSFIGGMRAAASCAAAERMASIVQICSVALACALCVLLAFSGGLAGLSLLIALLYQAAWSLLVSILPFMRRY